MQGQVTVPYMRIGGNNIGEGWGPPSGMMPMDLTGSTNPGEENEAGTTVNVRWMMPGGIVGKGGSIAEGNAVIPGWGYMLDPKVPCSDEDVIQWLIGQKTPTRTNSILPSNEYTREGIMAGDTRAMDDVNEMVSRYAHDVMVVGQFENFRKYYKGCVFFV